MNVAEAKFVKDFIRVTDDGFKKGWHERNGGNFSYRIKTEEVASIRSVLRPPEKFAPIGVSVPNLAGEYFLVTGSGKHMRNVILCPEDNLAIAVIDAKGENYSVVWGLANGGRPTSEFPTHLLNHSIKKELTHDRYRVIYHSHPANVIALTFVLPLTDKAFTRAMWEMMTECPVIFPQGIGVVPWMVPGGRDIAIATGELMKKYDVAIWAHHGIFCAGEDFDSTFGLMDTVEKSAEICVKVIAMGGKKQTITSRNFEDLACEFQIDLRKEFLD
ncbi:rhamnulose-1-phosphate aldolase [Acetonema longum]|uniref:Rhamnulose-1-phosphate aldolase n=1 Tax=Acetonema longum DSM 6540 TaxID=1009370 RepID=F7NEY1_9FIRM|nr:rhamnulose-1-phosphate aldolase [Acetonema longum]EGO65542.1 Rhamnulose-1-phosphate aldolase [Acetonema longum DSM 6540]